MKMKTLSLFAFAIALLSVALQSCDKDDEVKNVLTFKTEQEATLTMHHEETHKLEFDGRDGSNLKFVIKDTLVAKIANDGTVTAGLVGKTDYTVTQADVTLKGNVTVEPTVFSFDEPIFTPHKTTRKHLEENEKRTFSSEIPFGEDDLLLVYKGEKEGIKNIIYIYNVTGDYVKQAIVTLADKDYYTGLNVLKFLQERYQFTAYDNEMTDPLGNPCPIFMRDGKTIKATFVMGSPAVFYQDSEVK